MTWGKQKTRAAFLGKVSNQSCIGENSDLNKNGKEKEIVAARDLRLPTGSTRIPGKSRRWLCYHDKGNRRNEHTDVGCFVG